jgi:CubicO group peptidase (beta-lactamase class C family)
MRDSLKYDGLSFTDALNMKGVAQDLAPGELEVRAFEAGHDVLLFVGNPRAAIIALKAAVRSGRIDSVEVHRRYLRIIDAKMRWDCAAPLPPANYDAQRAEWDALRREIYTQAFTAVKPAPACDAVEFVGEGTPPAGLRAATSADQRVVLIFGPSTSTAWKKGAWTEEMKATLANHRAAGRKVSVVHLGNPYGLRGQPVEDLEGLWVGYENAPETRELAVRVAKGQQAAPGSLPVSGIPVPKFWSEATPEQAGFAPDLAAQIAAVVQRGIDANAYPGCQVVVARHGDLVHNRAYGSTDGSTPATPETWYDVASVTKILASVPLLLRAESEVQGGFTSRRMEELLPELKGSAIGRATAADVLAHQSGLPAWLPFYKPMLRQDGGFDHRYLRTVRDTVYRLPVAPGIWAADWMHDTLIARIARAPLGPKSYLYSDLGYYLFQRYLERRDGRSIERQLEDDWFAPIGASLAYNPSRDLPIAPTENDRSFRRQQLRGTVHDQGAALLGGVAGHAGIFGTAEGVARMMQLFLNEGQANGLNFANKASIQRFTACHACDQGNRRGLGLTNPSSRAAAPPACA